MSKVEVYRVQFECGEMVFDQDTRRRVPMFLKTEVMINGIPPEVHGGALMQLLLSLKLNVYKLRVGVTPDGFSRGYAIAVFYSTRDASSAIIKLHRFQITPDAKLHLAQRKNRRTLYVSGLRGVAPARVNGLRNKIEGVIRVDDQNLERGFAFLCFKSEPSARKGLQELFNIGKRLMGRFFSASWALTSDRANPYSNFPVHLSSRVENNTSQTHLYEAIRNYLPKNILFKLNREGDTLELGARSVRDASLMRGLLNGKNIGGEILDLKWPPRERWKRHENCHETMQSRPESVQPQVLPTEPGTQAHNYIPKMEHYDSCENWEDAQPTIEEPNEEFVEMENFFFIPRRQQLPEHMPQMIFESQQPMPEFLPNGLNDSSAYGPQFVQPYYLFFQGGNGEPTLSCYTQEIGNAIPGEYRFNPALMLSPVEGSFGNVDSFRMHREAPLHWPISETDRVVEELDTNCSNYTILKRLCGRLGWGNVFIVIFPVKKQEEPNDVKFMAKVVLQQEDYYVLYNGILDTPQETQEDAAEEISTIFINTVLRNL